MNYDGYEILRNQQAYKSGLLKFDSFMNSSADKYGSSTTGFWGHVDSVHTGITFSSKSEPRVKAFFKSISEGKDVFVPVWYKPDGKLTLERYPHENRFPAKRIWITAVTFFMFL